MQRSLKNCAAMPVCSPSKGANRFKLKAYRRAAETIEGLEEDVADLVKKGHDLTTLPGIGSAINASIIEIVQEGTLQRLERTLTRLSPEVVELASKPALDAKKIARIYKKLGIHSLAELKKNLDEGTIGKSLGAAGISCPPGPGRTAAQSAV